MFLQGSHKEQGQTLFWYLVTPFFPSPQRPSTQPFLTEKYMMELYNLITLGVRTVLAIHPYRN